MNPALLFVASFLGALGSAVLYDKLARNPLRVNEAVWAFILFMLCVAVAAGSLWRLVTGG